MRIATWNLNSIRARLAQLQQWLRLSDPGILAIQETKTPDADFPSDALAELGFQIAFAGQKSYNGVAVLSREPMEVDCTELPGFADPQRRVLGVRIGDLYVLNVYVPNGSELGSEKYGYKLRWLDALVAFAAQLKERHPLLAVLGDFNIAPTDADVHDPQLWQGRVLVSEPERERIRSLLDLGLADCFRLFPQTDDGYSWWDYRGGGFRRNHGLRIDLILASAALAERCARCGVDKRPRGWDKPSDHAPVLAEFELT